MTDDEKLACTANETVLRAEIRLVIRQRDILAAALRRIIATMDHAELDWTDPHTRLAVILEANDTLLDAELETEGGPDGEAE